MVPFVAAFLAAWCLPHQYLYRIQTIWNCENLDASLTPIALAADAGGVRSLVTVISNTVIVTSNTVISNKGASCD